MFGIGFCFSWCDVCWVYILMYILCFKCFFLVVFGLYCCCFVDKGVMVVMVFFLFVFNMFCFFSIVMGVVVVFVFVVVVGVNLGVFRLMYCG